MVASGGREVEELVGPGRRVGREEMMGGQCGRRCGVVGEVRPVVGHGVRDFGRELRRCSL